MSWMSSDEERSLVRRFALPRQQRVRQPDDDLGDV